MRWHWFAHFPLFSSLWIIGRVPISFQCPKTKFKVTKMHSDMQTIHRSLFHLQLLSNTNMMRIKFCEFSLLYFRGWCFWYALNVYAFVVSRFSSILFLPYVHVFVGRFSLLFLFLFFSFDSDLFCCWCHSENRTASMHDPLHPSSISSLLHIGQFLWICGTIDTNSRIHRLLFQSKNDTLYVDSGSIKYGFSKKKNYSIKLALFVLLSSSYFILMFYCSHAHIQTCLSFY